MPEVHAQVTAPWGDGITITSADLSAPWADGLTLHAEGGTYTPPAPPSGGTPAVPNTDPRFTIAPFTARNVQHALAVVDLRDGTALPVDSLSMRADEDSVFWSLTMQGKQALYAQLQAGPQPASVEVTLDGQVWRFVVQSVSRTRGFPDTSCRVSGLSLTAAAGAPYEFDQTWALTGDTTAAQIAAAANVNTGLEVVWGLLDWFVPAGVFSHFGTPLSVVKRVADSVRAMVQSDRRDFKLRVLPRYAYLPNEWPVVAPDVQISLDAVQSESFERADQPEYDGIYVAGQQLGASAFVRLAGTAGANLKPMVTDALLTADAACMQRGQAELGASGQKQRHTLSLPVLTGLGEPGVIDPGWLARVVEPDGTWWAMVRSVDVQVQLPSVRQSVVLERQAKVIPGTVTEAAAAPALLFTGPIPDVSVATGAAVSVNLAPYWSLGVPPYAVSLRSGALPAWLTLNRDLLTLAGTAPGSAVAATPLQFRVTDAVNSTADSNVLSIAAISPGVTQVLFAFNGNNGQMTGIQNLGAAGGTYRFDEYGSTKAQLDTSIKKFGTASGRCICSSTGNDPGLYYQTNTAIYLPTGGNATLGFWVRTSAGTVTPRFGILQWIVGSFSISATVESTTQVRIGISGASPVNLTTAVDTWHYVEVGIQGSTVYVFLDGILAGTVLASGTRSGTTGTLYLFWSAVNQGTFHIDDLFLKTGAIDNTTNFTPPTTARVP